MVGESWPQSRGRCRAALSRGSRVSTCACWRSCRCRPRSPGVCLECIGPRWRAPVRGWRGSAAAACGPDRDRARGGAGGAGRPDRRAASGHAPARPAGIPAQPRARRLAGRSDAGRARASARRPGGRARRHPVGGADRLRAADRQARCTRRFPLHHLSHPAHGFSSRSRVGRLLNQLRTRVEDAIPRSACCWARATRRKLRCAGSVPCCAAMPWCRSPGRQGTRVADAALMGGRLQVASGAPHLAMRLGAALLPTTVWRTAADGFVTRIWPALPTGDGASHRWSRGSPGSSRLSPWRIPSRSTGATTASSSRRRPGRHEPGRRPFGWARRVSSPLPRAPRTSMAGTARSARRPPCRPGHGSTSRRRRPGTAAQCRAGSGGARIRRAAARSAGSPGALRAAARPPAVPKISGFRCRNERGARPNSADQQRAVVGIPVMRGSAPGALHTQDAVAQGGYGTAEPDPVEARADRELQAGHTDGQLRAGLVPVPPSRHRAPAPGAPATSPDGGPARRRPPGRRDAPRRWRRRGENGGAARWVRGPPPAGRSGRGRTAGRTGRRSARSRPSRWMWSSCSRPRALAGHRDGWSCCLCQGHGDGPLDAQLEAYQRRHVQMVATFSQPA